MGKELSNTADIAKRILARCTRTPSGCLEWTGGKTLKGYGGISHNGKCYRTHRVMCAHWHGERGNEYMALHSCDNRACCERDHLHWGDHAKNMEERRARKPTNARLTPDDVRAIRVSEASWDYLASKYGVSRVTIGNAKAGRTWKHVV